MSCGFVSTDALIGVPLILVPKVPVGSPGYSSGKAGIPEPDQSVAVRGFRSVIVPWMGGATISHRNWASGRNAAETVEANAINPAYPRSSSRLSGGV
jgi:hypothetical protein